jgi:multidrug efflux pump subunit AcrA (membrane-fusion protein)
MWLRKPPTQKEVMEPQVLVSVAEIRPYNGPLTLELTGLVVPFREITIISEVTGRVVEKAEEFRAGHFVKAGTVLMTVDQTDYDLEISRLEAELEQSSSSLAELEVEIRGAKELVQIAANDLQLQEADFQRKRDANAGFSQTELDQVQRSVLAAQNVLSTQSNRLSLLEQSRGRLLSSQTIRRTDLELARIRRNRCIITAPADGVIISESVELNGFVQPGAQIMVFEDTSRAEVRCNFRADQMAWLWRHAPEAAQEVADGGGQGAAYRIPRVPVRVLHGVGEESLEWSGTLDRYDGLGVDDRTKTIPCRVTVPQPIAVGARGSRALVRGMFVKLRIELPTEPLKLHNQHFVEFPAKGLLPSNSVWIYRDGRLWHQAVQVINTIQSAEGRRTIVELQGDGLQMTDRVVVTPVGVYTPDMVVKIQNGPSGADDGETSVAKERTTIEREKTRLTGGSTESTEPSK